MSIQLLHKKLIKKRLTISVAESCTGGLLAHNFTRLANSSKYFQMGLTTYSNQAKVKVLKVNKNIIKKYKILMNIKSLHKKLIKKKLTISVAESCTGGLLAHNLTKLSNSSKYFQMGLTTYSNQAKIKILKVKENIISKYGAVSNECCKAMVLNLSKISKSKINVSITGIAGPGGGTKDKPVGLVYIGIKKGKNLLISKNKFNSVDRNIIQRLTVKKVIKLIIDLI